MEFSYIQHFANCNFLFWALCSVSIFTIKYKKGCRRRARATEPVRPRLRDPRRQSVRSPFFLRVFLFFRRFPLPAFSRPDQPVRGATVIAISQQIEF